MYMQVQKKQHGVITYYQKGTDPKLLIHTGTHGDEFSVIEPTKNYILKNADTLPDFIFVPEVSPTAVAQKSRKNKQGIDINRSFFEGSDNAEVTDNMELIKDFNFDICISIHEDYEFPSFYMYDSGNLQSAVWQVFVEKLNLVGMQTYTGFDDLSDPALGYEFKNGYPAFDDAVAENNSGCFSNHFISRSKSRRFLMPEVPTQCSKEVKEKVIALLFTDLLPLVNKT